MNYILIAFLIFIVLQYYQKKIERFSIQSPSEDISLRMLRKAFDIYSFDIPGYEYGTDPDIYNLPEQIDGNLYKNTDINEYRDIYQRIVKNKDILPFCKNCMNTRKKNPSLEENTICGECLAEEEAARRLEELKRKYGYRGS